MFTENLATTVSTSGPDHRPSRSPWLKLLFLVTILGVSGTLVGWLLFTRLWAPRTTSVNPNVPAETTPEVFDSQIDNSRLKYRLTVPEGWRAANLDSSDTTKDPELMTALEVFDPVVGQDKAMMTVVGVLKIAPDEESKLTSTTFNNIPARFYETDNPLGSHDRIYYLEHTVTPFIRIVVRSNGEKNLDAKLQELERSFSIME